ncbi:hypothetical protein [Nevskia sp.]|uniref:hypothetical protein n=1 Tax=Nevskia sp. TaxID=1929292 RepID=UPI0025FFA578|nr:hypothetical protein [Nevskia sp.]
MDEFLQSIYLEQVKQECEACFFAIRAFNAAVNSRGTDDPFVHAMALVHRAAAVSRVFWPPGAKDKRLRQRSQRRGDLLRNLLGVTPNHAIQSRTLRDHFEHFDERLDDWAERSKNRNIVKQLLGPRSAIGGDAIEDADIIHNYDPATKVYAFRGEKFDIQAIAYGIDDLHSKVVRHLEAIAAHRSARVSEFRGLR